MAPILRMPRPEPGQAVELGLKVGDSVHLINTQFLDLILDGASNRLLGYLVQKENPEHPGVLSTTFFNATEIASITWDEHIGEAEE